MQEKDGKYIFGVVKISEKGQIVIPKEARKTYNLQAGDALLLVGDKNGMAMLKTEIFSDFVGQVMEDLNQ
ncbi:MAG: AbrB/MazE/SpoVT family DNA-binding domain-containing protein [Tidjanibacter sp.]|nr:AbrB/MazE/SpoVT family DNA-binding domain-containing protein [Tidjanibacter sp.]